MGAAKPRKMGVRGGEGGLNKTAYQGRRAVGGRKETSTTKKVVGWVGEVTLCLHRVIVIQKQWYAVVMVIMILIGVIS